MSGRHADQCEHPTGGFSVTPVGVEPLGIGKSAVGRHLDVCRCDPMGLKLPGKLSAQIDMWAPGIRISADEFRFKLNGNLFADLEVLLGNARSNTSTNTVCVGSEQNHLVDRCLTDAGNGAPPAGMTCANHAGHLIYEKYGRAIGRENAQDDPFRSGDQSIISIEVARRLYSRHLRTMNLPAQRKLIQREAKPFQYAFTVLLDGNRVVARITAQVQLIEGRTANTASARRERCGHTRHVRK